MISHSCRQIGRIAVLLTVSLVALMPLRANAIMLSVDLDPSTPGIQSALSVTSGTSFDVDVVVTDAVNLHTFSINLGFDPAVVSATAVVGMSFFSPLPSFVFFSSVLPPAVTYLEAALGPVGAFGTGALARISFTAIADGSDLLSLDGTQLSAPNGGPITGAVFEGATVTVSSVVNQVPAPASLLLVALGLLGIGARRCMQASASRVE